MTICFCLLRIQFPVETSWVLSCVLAIRILLAVSQRTMDSTTKVWEELDPRISDARLIKRWKRLLGLGCLQWYATRTYSFLNDSTALIVCHQLGDCMLRILLPILFRFFVFLHMCTLKWLNSSFDLPEYDHLKLKSSLASFFSFSTVRATCLVSHWHRHRRDV